MGVISFLKCVEMCVCVLNFMNFYPPQSSCLSSVLLAMGGGAAVIAKNPLSIFRLAERYISYMLQTICIGLHLMHIHNHL